MRALIDTNILIDFCNKREPYYEDAKNVLRYFTIESNHGFISLHSISDIWYILRKNCNEDRRKKIRILCYIFTICYTTHSEVLNAIRNTNFNDFEDCLQDSCAYVNKCDYIITRNTKDYKHSRVKAISLKEAIKILA